MLMFFVSNSFHLVNASFDTLILDMISALHLTSCDQNTHVPETFHLFYSSH